MQRGVRCGQWLCEPREFFQATNVGDVRQHFRTCMNIEHFRFRGRCIGMQRAKQRVVVVGWQRDLDLMRVHQEVGYGRYGFIIVPVQSDNRFPVHDFFPRDMLLRMACFRIEPWGLVVEFPMRSIVHDQPLVFLVDVNL